ncbi:MAG: HEPN domain-containing protein [Bacteroidota bacterium]|nr:HEPN domain-containing protein [Bacteroidota bacterium]
MGNGLKLTIEAKQWIDKAEADFVAANRLIKHRRKPNYDLVCFCSHQCAEKYLKGFLTAANKRFEYKHQLEKLILPLCLEVNPSFEFIRELVRRLDAYSVDFRYPGHNTDRKEALLAVQTAHAVREFVREKLPIEKPQRKDRR